MEERGQVIDFEQARHELSAQKGITLDENHTKDSLQGEIFEFIDGLWLSAQGKLDLYEYIINSFSETGLIEACNDLGYNKWKKMITSMIYSEYWDRCLED